MGLMNALINNTAHSLCFVFVHRKREMSFAASLNSFYYLQRVRTIVLSYPLRQLYARRYICTFMLVTPPLSLFNHSLPHSTAFIIYKRAVLFFYPASYATLCTAMLSPICISRAYVRGSTPWSKIMIRHAILPFAQAAWMGTHPILSTFDRSAPPCRMIADRHLSWPSCAAMYTAVTPFSGLAQLTLSPGCRRTFWSSSWWPWLHA